MGEDNARSATWTHLALLAVFTAGQLVATGYRFATEDSANYAMLVWPRLEPAVYAGDAAFAQIWASPWNYHAAFFAEVMAVLAHLAPLEWIFFVLQALSLFGLFAAFWLIGRALGGPAVGWLTLIALLTTRMAGGTYVALIPLEFQPRTIAATLAFLAIALLANAPRYRLAAGLAGVATLLHPISALMALPVVALAPLLGETPWRSRLREAALAIAIASIPFLAWKLFQGAPPTVDVAFFDRIGASWQALIDARLNGQALNVGRWSAGSWLTVLAPLGFWLAASRARPAGARADAVLGIAVAAAVGLAAAGIVGADVFRLVGATQLMLSRLLAVPQVVGTAYVAWWLAGAWSAGGPHARLWVVAALAALALASMPQSLLALLPLALLRAPTGPPRPLVHAFGAGWGLLGLALAFQARLGPAAPDLARPDLLVFAEPPVVHLLVLGLAGATALAVASRLGQRRVLALTLLAALSPLAVLVLTNRDVAPQAAIGRRLAASHWPWLAPGEGWHAVAAWARSETPRGAKFLTPARQPGFRALAHRPIVTDWKDGGIVMFSDGLARDWIARYREVYDYAARPSAEVLGLAVRHGCAYVVMPTGRPLPAPVAFSSGGFVVYDVRGARRGS